MAALWSENAAACWVMQSDSRYSCTEKWAIRSVGVISSISLSPSASTCSSSFASTSTSISPGHISRRSSASCRRLRRLRHAGSWRSTAIPSMTSCTVNGRDEKHNRVRIRRASSIDPSSILHRIRSYVSSKLRGNDCRQWSRWLSLRGHRLRDSNWHSTQRNLCSFVS